MKRFFFAALAVAAMAFVTPSADAQCGPGGFGGFRGGYGYAGVGGYGYSPRYGYGVGYGGYGGGYGGYSNGFMLPSGYSYTSYGYAGPSGYSNYTYGYRPFAPFVGSGAIIQSNRFGFGMRY